MPKPTYVRLVIPSDKISGSTIHSPVGDYSRADALIFLRSITARFNGWLANRSGFKLNFNTDILVSSHTLEELQTNDDLTSAADGNGEGLSQQRAARLSNEDPLLDALQNSALYVPTRCAFFVVWGGGFAGTFRSNRFHPIVPPYDAYGHAFVGDIEFSMYLTGTADPWYATNSVDPTVTTPGAAWSHELLNALGVYAYGDEVFDGGDQPLNALYPPLESGYSTFPLVAYQPDTNGEHEIVMTAGQVHQLVKYNQEFIQEAH